MKLRAVVPLVLTLTFGAFAAPIELRASDGVRLHGEHTPVKRPRGVLLLVHSRYDGLHAFDAAARRFAELGYASVALDQRLGMPDMGVPNVTAGRVPQGRYTFADVLLDLEAAYIFARRTYPGARLFAMGEYDGASLLFPFAARHADLAGLIAWNPAPEAFLEGLSMLPAVRKVKTRVLLISEKPLDADEGPRQVYDALPPARRTLFVSKLVSGVDGARNLSEEDNLVPGSARAYWQPIVAFLR
ncbi:alpha/beta hydrolase [Deinococcus pimensis]|uniref:alpha/beta hydrolase n=1 Tax=Deinococcus pimensis TaxID=309888 RepID=UPI000693CD74|nr:alpha/beta hydrolase [Deinococcus pimensis]